MIYIEEENNSFYDSYNDDKLKLDSYIKYLANRGNDTIKFYDDNEVIDKYYKEFESLTNDKKRELYEKAHNGDIKIRNYILLCNIKLIFKIAKRYINNNDGLDYNDLISLGIIGGIKAIDSYDVNKSYKLSTYISRCISNEIMMILRKQSIPSNDIISLNSKMNDISSSSTDVDAECEFGDIIPDPNNNIEKFIDYQFSNELANKMNNIIMQSRIADRNKCIFKLYLNSIINDERLSISDIAKMFNTSPSVIHSIIYRITEMVRKQLQFNYSDIV